GGVPGAAFRAAAGNQAASSSRRYRARSGECDCCAATPPASFTVGDMSARSWFILGTLPMIVAGGAHVLLVLADEVRPTFLTPVDDSLRPRLESTTIRFRLLFPGGRGSARSMWRAWLGFNISHGLGLLTTGVVLLSLALHDLP